MEKWPVKQKSELLVVCPDENNEFHYCDFCFSNGNACPAASLEPEVKLTAREPGAVREAEMTVAIGESVNVQKTSAEGEMPSVSPSVSEAVHQSGTATVQHASTAAAAALLSQSVASPSTSTETKGIYRCLSVCCSFLLPRVGFRAHVCYHCRISPPHFLAECRKRRLNQGSFVLLFFRLFTLSDLYLVSVCLFSCTALFASISQVIGCEDRL